MGLTVGLAGYAHQPAYPLHDLIVGGAVAIWAILAESGYGAIYNLGANGLDRIVVQAEAPHDTGREVLHHHIGVLGQFHEYFLGLGVLQVQRQTSLISVDGKIISALFTDERRAPLSGVISRTGNLHLDHVRPVVSQHQCAERPCQGSGQVKHTDALKRLHVFLSSVLSGPDFNRR